MSTGRAKRVAIIQSSYIPWKGYLDIVASVDELILFDDRQYTRRDWRNRNRIKTPRGIRWLTIPVEVKGRYHQRIDEVMVSDPGWAERHWSTLAQCYAEAEHFAEQRGRFEELYRRASAERRLSAVNRLFLETLLEILGIGASLSWSSDYQAEGDRSERLLALCQAAGADQYVSGPSARAYLDEELFNRAGLGVHWFDYSGYREYPQPHPPFAHEVSVVDLIFSTGDAARSFLHSP